MQYVRCVSSLWSYARALRLRRADRARGDRGRARGGAQAGRGGGADITPWFGARRRRSSMLPLLARRRFPFAAPAAVWVVAATLSFVDGALVVFSTDDLRRGHGRLVPAREPARRRPGAGRACGRASAARRSSSTTSPCTVPASSSSSRCCSRSAGSAGFAVHERAEQAEAAEERATAAERERDAAARIAVAEERARIARELHDIVAHSVSVMVLQVGAVRHKLPGELAEDAEALRGVERTGRTRARRDAPAARRDAQRRRRPRARTAARPRRPRHAARRGQPRRACPSGCTSRAIAVRAAAGDRSLRLPDRAGGPDERAQARPREPGRRDRPLRARASCRSRCATTASAPRRATASATGSSASASASRSTAAR